MRVLLFQRHDSYRFIADFARDFEDAGHTAAWIPSTEGPRLPAHLRHFGPDFVFCVGASPAVAKAVGGRVPVVYYELDKILNHALWDGTPAGDRDVVFTTYRDDIGLFRQFGFQHVHYLPFCPNISRRSIDDADHAAAGCRDEGVTFVGSFAGETANDYRMLLVHARNKLANQPEAFSVFRRLADHLAGILAEQDRHLASLEYRIPELLETHSTPEIEAAKIRFRLPTPTLAALLAKEVAYRQRKLWIEQLPFIDVWGPDQPHSPPPGVTYHGPVDQYEGCAQVFRTAAANLSLQRLYARDGLSDRVFNVMAAGGCLLADANPAVLELFEPGFDLLTYSSPEELREQTARLQADIPLRTRLARNGRRCVEARHLFRHRIDEMLVRLPGAPIAAAPRVTAPRAAAGIGCFPEPPEGDRHLAANSN